jgi:hypothetical protein
MKAHLGVEDSVEVIFKENGEILLKRPMHLTEARERSRKKFSAAYEELSK